MDGTGRGGLAVSASVYVDRDAVAETERGKDIMTATAERDKALSDDDALGGLNAVVYSKLPVREWDRWLDAKMSHPFYVPVDEKGACNSTKASDLLEGVPSAVPSGAFGGSEVRIGRCTSALRINHGSSFVLALT